MHSFYTLQLHMDSLVHRRSSRREDTDDREETILMKAKTSAHHAMRESNFVSESIA